ncbi:MAG: hypothetical protein AB1483_05860 [Candidatus Zixiibacteriota bacterium]
MLRSGIVIGLVALAMFIAAGCGDDDCPSCPTNVDTLTVTDTVEVPQEFPAYVSAYLQLDPYAYFNADILGNGGANPWADSFAVGETVVSYIDASYWWHEAEPYFWIEWEEGGTAPYMYESGDLAAVTIWGNDGMSSTASVVILDYDADASVIMVPSLYDTSVYYGNDMEFAWSRVENAEWYGVELNYRVDTSGTGQFRWYNVYTYTYDTTMIVQDTMMGYPVDRVHIYALPTTGPDPESYTGNWEGDYATGKLYSISYYAYAVVYFENEGPTYKAAVDRSAEIPAKSPGEIIEAVYEAYK